MKQWNPQELVLPVINTTKANLQNKGSYSEASIALNYHTPIHQFFMLEKQQESQVNII